MLDENDRKRIFMINRKTCHLHLAGIISENHIYLTKKVSENIFTYLAELQKPFELSWKISRSYKSTTLKIWCFLCFEFKSFIKRSVLFRKKRNKKKQQCPSQSRTRDSTPCRVGRQVSPSVGPSVTFLNSERFSHYCSCPNICDWNAVYPALFLFFRIFLIIPDDQYFSLILILGSM